MNSSSTSESTNILSVTPQELTTLKKGRHVLSLTVSAILVAIVGSIRLYFSASNSAAYLFRSPVLAILHTLTAVSEHWERNRRLSAYMQLPAPALHNRSQWTTEKVKATYLGNVLVYDINHMSLPIHKNKINENIKCKYFVQFCLVLRLHMWRAIWNIYNILQNFLDIFLMMRHLKISILSKISYLVCLHILCRSILRLSLLCVRNAPNGAAYDRASVSHACS